MCCCTTKTTHTHFRAKLNFTNLFAPQPSLCCPYHHQKEEREAKLLNSTVQKKYFNIFSKVRLLNEEKGEKREGSITESSCVAGTILLLGRVHFFLFGSTQFSFFSIFECRKKIERERRGRGIDQKDQRLNNAAVATAYGKIKIQKSFKEEERDWRHFFSIFFITSYILWLIFFPIFFFPISSLFLRLLIFMPTDNDYCCCCCCCNLHNLYAINLN